MRKFNKIAALGIAGALVLGACGSDEKKSDGPATGTVDCKPIKAGVLSVVTSLPGPNFWGTPAGESPTATSSPTRACWCARAPRLAPGLTSRR